LALEPWGDGIYDAAAIKVLEAHLRADELVVAREIHPDADWPVVIVSFKTVARKKGHLGKNPTMIDFRETVGRLLLRLAITRRDIPAKEPELPQDDPHV